MPNTCFDVSVLNELERQEPASEVNYRIHRQYTFNCYCSTANKKKIKDFITVCWYTKRWWMWIQQMSPINNLDPERVVIQVSNLSNAILWTKKWWDTKPTEAKLFFSPLYTSIIGQTLKRNALLFATKNTTSVTGLIKWSKKYFILYPSEAVLKVANNRVDCYMHDFKEGHIIYDDVSQQISLILTSSYKIDTKQYIRSNYADNRVCGIDPGLSNFLTIYDPSGENRCIKLGNKSDRMWLQTSVEREKHFRKMWHQPSANKTSCEIEIKTIKSIRKDTLDHFYHKICQYLITHYSIINIGEFDSKDVWNHAHFIDMLLSYENDVCKIFVVNEQNTTIICSRCGRITPINNTRIYTCQFCTVILDRDMNAARNILEIGFNNPQIVKKIRLKK